MIQHIWRNIKVRTKFLFILTLAMLLVLSGVLATFRMPYKAYDRQLYQSSTQVITLFAGQIQSELDDVREISMRILSDNVLQKNLGLLKRLPINTTAWVEAKNEVADRMANFSLWFSSGFSLQLKTPAGTTFSRFFRNAYVPDSDMLPERIQDAANHEGRAVWRLESRDGEMTHLFLLREIREMEGLTLDTLATLQIELDLKTIIENRLHALNALGTPLTCAVYSEDGICLYAGNERVRQITPGEDGYERIRQPGEDLLCVQYTASNGWRYVTLIDYSGISATIDRVALRTWVIDGIIVAVALLLSMLLADSLLKHLRRLVDKFDAFAVNGHVEDLGTSPYRDRGDEMGRLHRHFDRMARDYHLMMKRNFEQQQLLQEKQMQQLRAQVRPHFLNNVLESIYCLAQQEGNSRIAVMTESLGKMLRSSMNDKRDIVTVEQDLETAKAYIRIQEIRYMERMQVRFDVEKEIKACLVPAMTIQPLVENAVHHAVEEMTDICRILIEGRQEGGEILLTIEDNGPGMDEDILNKLERGEVKAEGMGIGMRNIDQRIKHTFGEKYGLQVSSEPGKTRVTARLPKTLDGAKGESGHV